MGIDFALSPEGYEMTLVINHLGPFLFTNLLMPKILASKSPRVVNIGSEGHRFNPIRWGDWNFQVRTFLLSPKRKLTTNFFRLRKEKPTTSGRPTVNPRQQIC